MTDYQDRQNWDLAAWPEMYAKLKELQMMVLGDFMNRYNDGLATGPMNKEYS